MLHKVLSRAQLLQQLWPTGASKVNPINSKLASWYFITTKRMKRPIFQTLTKINTGDLNLSARFQIIRNIHNTRPIIGLESKNSVKWSSSLSMVTYRVVVGLAAAAWSAEAAPTAGAARTATPPATPAPSHNWPTPWTAAVAQGGSSAFSL